MIGLNLATKYAFEIILFLEEKRIHYIELEI